MKLVLFDIDGTLIFHVGDSRSVGFPRFEYAIKKVYGIDVHFISTGKYNGTIDKQIVRSVVGENLFPQKAFDMRWPKISDALFEYANLQEKDGKKLYAPIDEAIDLVELLALDKRFRLGILTGNVEKMAYWKLRHAGIKNIFSLLLCSDVFRDRISLAQSVFDTYEKTFHEKIEPSDIIIVGDSIHDIRCGKAIGAITIAVCTSQFGRTGGIHGRGTYINYVRDLEKEKPDIIVPSLMDKKVLDFFGLDKVQQKNT